ncbi:MAG: hypothetical protein LBV04_07525 [Deferribacteraceae bacterium]|jgi:hypothetical protein|nr:hypothetical protein [Deferribacteraceae bacterium]
MIMGATIYYKCPDCGKFTKTGSMISGNNFGGVMYSDAREEAPMLAVFPEIVKCQNCKTFYWLDNQNRYGETESMLINTSKIVKRSDPELQGAYDAAFLSVEEYAEAIESELYRNQEELEYLRRWLWWTYNDRSRRKKDLYVTEYDNAIYEQNCHSLIGLLDKSDETEEIMIAELFRNLGDFDACLKILENLKDKYTWLKDLLIEECNKNNRLTIVLRK